MNIHLPAILMGTEENHSFWHSHIWIHGEKSTKELEDVRCKCDTYIKNLVWNGDSAQTVEDIVEAFLYAEIYSDDVMLLFLYPFWDDVNPGFGGFLASVFAKDAGSYHCAHNNLCLLLQLATT